MWLRITAFRFVGLVVALGFASTQLNASPACIPDENDPETPGVITIRGKSPTSWNQNYDIQVANQAAIEFKVQVGPDGILLLKPVGGEEWSTYNNVEFDAFPISGNFSWSRNTHSMTLIAYVRTEAENYFVPPADIGEPAIPLEPALTGTDPNIRKCFLPKIFLQLKDYPKVQSSHSLDFGPSLSAPYNLLNVQVFTGFQVESFTGGGQIMTAAGLEVDPKKELYKLKEALEANAFPDAASRNMAASIVQNIEALARNGPVAPDPALDVLQYIKKLHFVIAPALSALDKLAAMKLVEKVPANGYFYKRAYPDAYSSDAQRARELVLRGEALSAAADEVLKTFICRFPRSVLSRLHVPPLVRRYRNACHEIRVKEMQGSVYPYYPESPPGQEIADLLDDGNEGAPLFYHLAEVARYGKPLYKVNGSEADPTDRCAGDRSDPPSSFCKHWYGEYANGGAYPGRKATLDFINRLATDPDVASEALRHSGLLFRSELAQWEATPNNRTFPFLMEILGRYEVGSGRSWEVVSGRSYAWHRWNSPYETGKQVVMAHLAHKYLRKFDTTSPLELHPNAANLGRRAKWVVNQKTRRDAVQFCLDRGMALSGEAGSRGFQELESENIKLSGVFTKKNVLPLYMDCDSPVWMELDGGGATQWSKPFWATAGVWTHVMPSFLKYSSIATGDYSAVISRQLRQEVDRDIYIRAGTVCVAGSHGRRPTHQWSAE